MRKRGILLAAPGSGSGKTTITCALLAALKKRNIPVRSFKSGPDYIDPMFHSRVIGIPSRNLDTFFSEASQIQELYDYGEEGMFSVIEGAMGIYDGLGGTQKEGSAYHLAQTLDLSVILVVDAHGMGRTLLALLAGIQSYDTDKRLAGVILNRITPGFYGIIAPIIEEELHLPVLGFFPKATDLQMESRHLGLKMPDEIAQLQTQVAHAAELLEANVDVEKLLEMAGWKEEKAEDKYGAAGSVFDADEKSTVRIAVAKDEAFCFYYEDNLRMLHEAGADLVAFSPLHDKQLPENVQGILLGGGYPELCAEALSGNVSMRKSIREAIARGMPSVAECGGFMYLHETLTDEKGQTYPMAGAIRGGCHNTGKLVRFGYVNVTEQESHFLSQKVIRAHEFHYYDSDSNGESCEAVKPTTGRKWKCIHEGENFWWGYPHLYYPSNPAFVEHFIGEAKKWKKRENRCKS